MAKRVRRNRKGELALRLPDGERAFLRSLLPSVREAFSGMDPRQPDSDPAVARLFPGAYVDDPERDGEYRRLMHDDLAEGRLAALETFEAGIDAEQLEEQEALAWLRAINDIRLLLGTRLDVTEDPATHEVDPADPRAAPLSAYHYLSLIQEELVEALSS